MAWIDSPWSDIEKYVSKDVPVLIWHSYQWPFSMAFYNCWRRGDSTLSPTVEMLQK